MNCPKCSAAMQAGTMKIVNTNIGKVAVLADTLLTGPPLFHLCFTLEAPKGEFVEIPRIHWSYRCRACNLFVLGGEEDTRQEMVARWQALQKKPGDEQGN